MKRTLTRMTLTAIAMAMFVATGVSAITISVDTDKATYNVGEDIVLTITAIADGTELAGGLQYVAVAVGWDNTVASVKNVPAGAGFGQASQTIAAGPNAGGSGLSTITTPSGTPFLFDTAPANPACLNEMICSVLLQNVGFLPAGQFFTTLDAQTLVGTLVLQADALGLVGLGFDTIDILGTTTSGGFTIGANFTTAKIVPEPSTALLLGLGLVGLALRTQTIV